MSRTLRRRRLLQFAPSAQILVAAEVEARRATRDLDADTAQRSVRRSR